MRAMVFFPGSDPRVGASVMVVFEKRGLPRKNDVPNVVDPPAGHSEMTT